MQKEKGEERGGGTGPHSFQRKEVFRGAWVKRDSISVHEKSALRLPFPPRPPPALTPLLSQHLDQTEEGRASEAGGDKKNEHF